jgi:lipopolysaccharide/colanic/teichoic acid biosynthesis glycosyltransferase
MSEAGKPGMAQSLESSSSWQRTAEKLHRAVALRTPKYGSGLSGITESDPALASLTLTDQLISRPKPQEGPTHAPFCTGISEKQLYYICKRCLDLCLAVSLLILLLPLLLLIALLIKIDSSGPVFFTHERVGARRARASAEAIWVIENFRMHKFRSMVQNADSAAHEAYIRDFVQGRVQPDTANGGKFKLTNDPRVTRIGRILRRTSLDELPQLFNVLKGQMSLVGPRPVPPYEVACYRTGDHKRLTAPPGITGLWQVNGRCQVSFEEMIHMDVEYIQKASLWIDLQILFLTIPAVLFGRGAE